MAMSMGGGGASAPQMNVTPLIDVLLVLIIIFMGRIQGGDSATAGESELGA